MNLKSEYRRLFYSNLTENQIKKELGLTTMEYRDLYQWVKQSDKLPMNYRRRPSKSSEYNQYSYYICKYDLVNDDYIIISYYMSEKEALQEVSLLDKDNNVDYFVELASDDNLKRLIEYEYYINNYNWERIISNLRLPYHKFYELLNIIKKENNDETMHSNRVNRFIYPNRNNKSFFIRKIVNGHANYYGTYNNLEDAIRVRDFLETVSWNKDAYKEFVAKLNG